MSEEYEYEEEIYEEEIDEEEYDDRVNERLSEHLGYPLKSRRF